MWTFQGHHAEALILYACPCLILYHFHCYQASYVLVSWGLLMVWLKVLLSVSRPWNEKMEQTRICWNKCLNECSENKSDESEESKDLKDESKETEESNEVDDMDESDESDDSISSSRHLIHEREYARMHSWIHDSYSCFVDMLEEAWCSLDVSWGRQSATKESQGSFGRQWCGEKCSSLGLFGRYQYVYCVYEIKNALSTLANNCSTAEQSGSGQVSERSDRRLSLAELQYLYDPEEYIEVLHQQQHDGYSDSKSKSDSSAKPGDSDESTQSIPVRVVHCFRVYYQPHDLVFTRLMALLGWLMVGNAIWIAELFVPRLRPFLMVFFTVYLVMGSVVAMLCLASRYIEPRWPDGLVSRKARHQYLKRFRQDFPLSWIKQERQVCEEDQESGNMVILFLFMVLTIGLFR